MKYFFLIAIPAFFLISCASHENGNGKTNSSAIFFDYLVRGEEKDSNVTLYIQFKAHGANGPSLVLSDPAKVELDGENISLDSAKLTGAYYEIQKPLSTFPGKHTIVFTDFNDKQWKEEFEYKPFCLKNVIPAIIYRGEVSFDLEGLDSVDEMRVSATDTSFTSKDINEIDTIKNGQLILSKDRLKNLVDGPVTMLLLKETEMPVKEGKGKIVVNYGLEREFELRSKINKSK